MTPSLRVKEAIKAIKQGKMIIMVDDEDRENEGDLVYASAFSTPEHVNFMATHAKGLICVAITEQTAHRLQLAPMVSSNTSSHETAFTVSVDAIDASTGISADERDMAIKILANPISRADELVRPGHIFPLIAKDGGTLVRVGHTEGSVDICRLAGISESAVICEMMKEDGSMARRDDLDLFAKKFNLPILYISDIVEYRLANETLVEVSNKEEIEFFGANVVKYDFIDHEKREHTAILFGDIEQTSNIKMHNIISDAKLLLNQNRYNRLINSISYLKEQGGVLVFIDNPEMSSSTNLKEYGVGAQILKDLGVKHMRLITDVDAPSFAGLAGFGLDIAEVIHLEE